jgi:hypothetical protein
MTITATAMEMTMDINNFSLAHTFYEEAKFWIGIGTAFWILFKAINWVKSIKENDIPHIQNGVNELKTSMESVHTELKEQTSAVVTELKDIKADLRTYFAPVPKSRKK